jgi:response regulator RpfG family c-di-GMP phosphodiesterase
MKLHTTEGARIIDKMIEQTGEDEDAIQIITNSADKFFDPKIVDVFIEVHDQLKATREALCQ